MNEFQGNPVLATVYAVIAFIAGLFASIVPHIELIVRVGAGVAATASALAALRYYRVAYQEKKESLKKLKSQ